ncbi:hypothetical protein M8C21_003482 [Ambrosia artemisiifolia]|uniref:Uncharacterized protein n=1 Tax=Ambrosia artemisiifolia TaxID=4212 RepID=A0AAD5D9D6_AMBAR|nr:hypothetical protein M8C21_003482 [Ambrosia artemisiifolia]
MINKIIRQHGHNSSNNLDGALTTIVKMSSRNVVVKEGFADQFQIPKPLSEAITPEPQVQQEAFWQLRKPHTQKNPPNTTPDNIRTPDSTYKKSDTTTSTSKRSFEEPGPISETKLPFDISTITITAATARVYLRARNLCKRKSTVVAAMRDRRTPSFH